MAEMCTRDATIRGAHTSRTILTRGVPHVAVLLLTCLVGQLLCQGARAGVYQYVEDFTSKTFCDTAVTTARWDTGSAEIGFFPRDFTVVGATATSGTAVAVVVTGNVAYIADGGSGVQVVDITDPSAQLLLGSYDTAGDARDVAIRGDHACVADGAAGLIILDVTDPANPVLAGSLDTPGTAEGVAVAGNLVFIADGDEGLRIVDIDDPLNPVVAGSHDTPGYAYAVLVAGNEAYVADGAGGLAVFDITDPAVPAPAGSLATMHPAVGLAAAGDRLLLATGYGGVEMVDISDPAAPVSTGGFTTAGSAEDVTLLGDYAFVPAGASGMRVHDLVDFPTCPEIGGCVTGGDAQAVVVSGNHAFVAAGSAGLVAVDARDRVNPVRVGSYGDPPTFGVPDDVVVAGDHAYTIEWGFQVYDISDPTNPLLIGSDPDVHGSGVAVDGNHAFVATNQGFAVFDISDPALPLMVGGCDTLGASYAVAVSGNLAYLARGGDGFSVIDVADPTSPVVRGSCLTAHSTTDVVIHGDYAFVAEWSAGTSVIDISDPMNPLLVTTLNTSGASRGLALEGDHLYVADHSNTDGLLVVDVSDPENPVIIGACDVGYSPASVAVDGDHAYVLECSSYGGSTLHVVDVSDPTAPIVIDSSLSLPIEGNGLAIGGDYACVVGRPNDLYLDDPFHVVCVAQGLLDGDGDTGQSVDIEPHGYDVARVRLSSTQADSIRWQVSADGGLNWGHVLPNYLWHELPAFGSELLWQSTHGYAGTRTNPSCSYLEMDWLTTFPTIDAITDVPNDQGGQVSISWTRSGYDFPGSPNRIVEYAVYRRVDGRSARAISRKDRLVAAQDGEAPSVYWHYVMSVPAFTEEEYAVVVPTLVDSTAAAGTGYSVFFLRALTEVPGIHYDCPPDSGYSVDNLSPEAPIGLVVDYGATENVLAWDESPEPDLDHYRVYRSTDPEFVIGPESLVHTTVDAEWVDEVEQGWQYHYRITAVDVSGNESDAAAPSGVTGVDSPDHPLAFALHQSAPNPFARATTLRYDVPAPGGRVEIAIYDVAGRRVRVLVDRFEEPGRKRVVWDGRDEGGRPVAAGAYYCRIDAPGFSETVKLMVLR